MNVDLTLDPGEEIRFLCKYSALAKRLLKTTHFTMKELEIVLLIYYKMLKTDPERSSGTLISRQQFTTVFDTVFGLADGRMLRRIYAALDKGTSVNVTMETWAHTCSLFLRGTLDEKMLYCFRVYDVQGEGLIRRDHLMVMLRETVYQQSEGAEESVKDLVDLIINKMDVDRDGAISFDDYRQTVRRMPLLLECFGQALPDRPHIEAFAMTFLC